MTPSACSRRVLVVEDDMDVREALLEALADDEYQARGAANGVEALASLRSGGEAPCVIILDMMMPVMDGWTFRVEQSRDPLLRSIPVIVLSAAADAEDAAGRLGVASFLRKPVRLDVLLAIVRKFCETSGPPS